MDPGTERSGPPQAAPVTTTLRLSVARPGDAWRAGRELGEMLGFGKGTARCTFDLAECSPWATSDLDDPDPDLWHTSWSDRGVPEREAAGLQLLAAGWVPR